MKCVWLLLFTAGVLTPRVVMKCMWLLLFRAGVVTPRSRDEVRVAAIVYGWCYDPRSRDEVCVAAIVYGWCCDPRSRDELCVAGVVTPGVVVPGSRVGYLLTYRAVTSLSCCLLVGSGSSVLARRFRLQIANCGGNCEVHPIPIDKLLPGNEEILRIGYY